MCANACLHASVSRDLENALTVNYFHVTTCVTYNVRYIFIFEFLIALVEFSRINFSTLSFSNNVK